MKKHVMLFTALIASVCVFAFPDVGRIAFRVVAVDERAGLPLKNVPVIAVFTDRPVRWGDDSVERVERRLTDVKGMCKFTGTSNHGAGSYIVEEVPGYYATSMIRYQATNERSSIIPIPYRCEPYDCVYTTLLQRIEHPIPLYAREVRLKDRQMGIAGFDGTNVVLRYDFIEDDWLPPHGRGKLADIVISAKYRLKDKVNDGKFVVQMFYDFTVTIDFPGVGNGMTEKIADLNCGIMMRTAPESGYNHSKTLHFGRRRKHTTVKGIYPEHYTDSDKRRCYCFRIRSKHDDRGKLVEAYYGKIYGDFNFNGNDRVGLSEVAFAFYLNPKSLDRNLEWDTKNNLCTKPGNLPFKLTNKPRLEP